VGLIAAWVSSASEDVSLLTRAYLPELLVITVFVFVSWAIRRVFSREHHRPSR
jgi:hypothetical protein